MLGGPAAQFLACPAGDSAFFTCPPRLYHYTRLALRIDAAWLLGHPFAQPPLRKQLIWANGRRGPRCVARVARRRPLPDCYEHLDATGYLYAPSFHRVAPSRTGRRHLPLFLVFPTKWSAGARQFRFCGQPSIYRADGTARTQPKQNAAVSARFFRKRLYRC